MQGLSAVVEDIGDGEFWWQITPYFSLDNIGYANPSQTQLFSLKTAIGDAPPELISPGHGIKITYGEKKQSQIKNRVFLQENVAMWQQILCIFNDVPTCERYCKIKSCTAFLLCSRESLRYDHLIASLRP